MKKSTKVDVHMINDFLINRWHELLAEGNAITKLEMTKSCQDSLSNRHVKNTPEGVFFAGLLINTVDDVIFKPWLKITTPEGVERYYVFGQCIRSVQMMGGPLKESDTRTMGEVDSVENIPPVNDIDKDSNEHTVSVSIAGGLVYGEYTQIKAVQALIIENEELTKKLGTMVQTIKGALGEAVDISVNLY